MSDFLLAGVRVIDAASFIAGPVATTIMADLGADVIKIEPPDGDPYRNRTGGPGVAESPYNYRWIIDNRTKRGLALDLRHPAGPVAARWCRPRSWPPASGGTRRRSRPRAAARASSRGRRARSRRPRSRISIAAPTTAGSS